MDCPTFDLKPIALRVVKSHGFDPEFSAEIMAQVNALGSSPEPGEDQDLRHLLWSSIDNGGSQDLDQAEYAEALNDTTIRLLVAISDVDSRVPIQTAADAHARWNTTSLYTGTGVFPLFPERVSNDLTSLLFNRDRRAVIIELHVSELEEPKVFSISTALIRNHAALNYLEVGAWFTDSSRDPDFSRVPGLLQQLRLQRKAGDILAVWAAKRGVVSLSGVESKNASSGGAEPSESMQFNAARNMIQQFMVTANTEMAEFLQSKGCPVILRAVRKPMRWDKIRDIALAGGTTLPVDPSAKSLALYLRRKKSQNPAGYPDLALTILKLLGKGEYFLRAPHDEPGEFGVGVQDYTHSTAPNRRFVDLITQRIVKAFLAGNEMPYKMEDLSEIAARCTEREDACRKVERTLRKVMAAYYLRCRIGEVFHGLVTGASQKGVYVKLDRNYGEGKIIRNEAGLDVGDRIEVRLLGVDVEQGFIDFERI